MKKFSRILTAVVATATTAATTFAAAPAAQAARGNTVLFGDSYFANTSIAQLIDTRLNGGPQCIRGDYRVATEISAQSGGTQVDDYSCNGTQLYLPGYTLENEIDQAIADGKLNGNTLNVPIMIGANDTYRTPAPIDNVAAALSYDRAFDKIKKAAPAARVIFTSYPSITNDRAGLCAIRINGLPPTELPFPIVQEAERQLFEQSRTAAERHAGAGAVFLDLRNQTKGHDTCAPGGEAWVAGVLDNQTPQYNLTMHMAHPGVRNAAQQIVSKMQ
ncbi:SGNH/GDSL hydrolase family protein [Corynebacterium heidelbergense]|uniref:SGNH hydrolase-type esterase domain-containing protein n=1 Tax=Corynebacterium heidelbergense TaxID=2055947 RepID=A0A364VCF8_9CORY|nr:SGNH/GDSL hydrolase family protein [Corynebacterium heidelbergense]RAV34333.1 hypothetical protein CWC39_03815 [Corynebacterium heidelbergense]WCZ35729.1 Esterase precursor [Corynebacterium heidelbergense]